MKENFCNSVKKLGEKRAKRWNCIIVLQASSRGRTSTVKFPSLFLFDESWRWECAKWTAEYHLSNYDRIMDNSKKRDRKKNFPHNKYETSRDPGRLDCIRWMIDLILDPRYVWAERKMSCDKARNEWMVSLSWSWQQDIKLYCLKSLLESSEKVPRKFY